jgi:hypothetical protein
VIRAGAQYFGAVFLVGFVLGTVRVLVVAPRLGELGSTLLELPVVLAAAWWLSARIVRRYAVPQEPRARLAMGGVAFALLMMAEAGLSIVLFSNSLAEHVGRYGSLPAALGLAGQALFGLFPLLQLRSLRSRG